MTRYILRRLLQAIPLLFIISLVLFLLMQSMGDPLATMGGRTATRSADRERLTRQLGLDKPLIVQYIYWLIGNDWTMIDMDGDGVAETPGKRRGVLRGDFGTSLVNRGVPVTEVFNTTLSGYKNWDSLNLSEETWKDYQTHAKMMTLVLSYGEPVRVHSIYKYYSTVDTLVVPLDARHDTTNAVFGLNNGVPASGALHVEEITSLRDYVREQGLCSKTEMGLSEDALQN